MQRARAREQQQAADAAERAAVRDFALTTPQFASYFEESPWESGAWLVKPGMIDNGYAVFANNHARSVALVAIVDVTNSEGRFDMRCILPSATYYEWDKRFDDRDPCTLDGAKAVD